MLFDFKGNAAGEEKLILVYRDLTTYTKGNKALRPTRTYTHHSSIVNDVQHHPLHSSLIGTVSDDITLQIIDVRAADTTRAAACGEGQHRDAINSISFNPAAETILATGSADKTIGLWDLRNLKTKLHSLEGHTDSVQSVSWHPFEESVLASSSYDRKIMFWDLSRAGEEQTPDDAQDGPPELYVHQSFRLFLLSLTHKLVSLCTVATPTVSPTSAGTSATPGFCAQLPRTICCKFGRSPMRLSARIWRTSLLKNWKHDLLHLYQHPPQLRLVIRNVGLDFF
jgi:WD40 repeat protein